MMHGTPPLRAIVSGTDTGVGKTVLAALLTLVTEGTYWKPVQAGTDGGTDRETVETITGLDARHFAPEAYVLTRPMSPDQAARVDGVAIDPQRLSLPEVEGSLIVEGAGGLMVPLSDELLQIDLFARWKLPVVLAVRSGLGTLNHTLLSLAALRSRAVPVPGFVMIGDEHAANRSSLERWAEAPLLGTLPVLKHLDAEHLREAYRKGFTPIEAWGGMV